MTTLADDYAKGQGVGANLDKAVALLQKAADGGEKYAFIELDHVYREGKSLAKDLEKQFNCGARRWRKQIRHLTICVLTSCVW